MQRKEKGVTEKLVMRKELPTVTVTCKMQAKNTLVIISAANAIMAKLASSTPDVEW